MYDKIQLVMHRIVLLLLTLGFCNVHAQNYDQHYISKDWESVGSQPDTINWGSTIVTGLGDQYFVGNRYDLSEKANILVTKRNTQGVLLWSTEYDGVSSDADYGVDLAQNSAGGLYVIGASYSSTSAVYESVLLKADASGNLVWSTKYTVSGFDAVPTSLYVDANDNVYISAVVEQATGSDVHVLKVNSDGNQIWARQFNNASLTDIAGDIQEVAGNISVTGATQTSVSSWSSLALSFDTAGTPLDTVIISEPGVHIEIPRGFAKGPSDEIVLGGTLASTSGLDAKVIKINADFSIEFADVLDDGGDDEIYDVAIDGDGKIYAVGYIENSSGFAEAAIVKYDSDGTVLWTKKLPNQSPYLHNKATGVELSVQDHPIVVGFSEYSAGNHLWLAEFDKTGSPQYFKTETSFEVDIDYPTALAAQGNNLYISGKRESASGSEYIRMKYITNTLSSPVDSTGDSIRYLSDQIIVSFDPSVIDGGVLSNPQVTHGLLEDILIPSAYTTVEPIFRGTVQSKPIAYKVFRRLTDQTTFSISRSGDTVPIPDFYCSTFIVKSVSGLGEDSILELLDSTSIVRTQTLNYVGEKQVCSPIEGPEYGLQLSLEDGISGASSVDINAEEAWCKAEGSRNVRVGIYDSGIFRFQEDLVGQIVDGYDYIGNTSYLTEPPYDGHGTSVAGIIGAKRNNNLGIAGIAGGDPDDSNPGVGLVDMTIDGGGLTLGTALMAIEEGARSISTGGYGLHIANHSWVINSHVPGSGPAGWNSSSPRLFTSAAHFAFNNGVLTVAARGNVVNNVCTSSNRDRAGYPAGVLPEFVVSVGASNATGDIDNGSCYGTGMDLIAPGTSDIVQTTFFSWFSSPPYPIDDYLGFDLTSAAAPHVAGAAALAVGYVEDLVQLAPDDINYLLTESAVDIAPSGPDAQTGAGRLEANAMLDLIELPEKRILHYRVSGDDSHLVLDESDAQISITDIIDAPLETGTYFGDVYKVESTINHSLPASTVINAYWPLNSYGNVSPKVGISPILTTDQHSVALSSVSNAGATVTGYFYFIEFNSLGGVVNRWFPFDPTTRDWRMGYSLLVEDANYTLPVQEQSECSSLVLAPNPTATDIRLTATEDCFMQGDFAIYDGQGKIRLTGSLQDLRAGLTLENLPPSIYYVEMVEDKTQHRLIKKFALVR